LKKPVLPALPRIIAPAVQQNLFQVESGPAFAARCGRIIAFGGIYPNPPRDSAIFDQLQIDSEQIGAPQHDPA
jgi:hypothetical protein